MVQRDAAYQACAGWNKLPNLFIAGVSRAGTSALHKSLATHSSIDPGQSKEKWVYNVADRYGSRSEIFHREFIRPGAKYRLDSTPHYFSGTLRWASRPGPATISEVRPIQLVLKDSPNAKFVVSLRHPVERYVSEYLMNRFKQKPDVEPNLVSHINKNLDGLVPAHADYLYMSRFGTFSTELLEATCRENVKFLFFESWINDSETLGALTDWLGLSTHSPSLMIPRQNSGEKYQRPKWRVFSTLTGRARATRKAIQALWEAVLPEIRTLEELLGALPESWNCWTVEDFLARKSL